MVISASGTRYQASTKNDRARHVLIERIAAELSSIEIFARPVGCDQRRASPIARLQRQAHITLTTLTLLLGRRIVRATY